MNKTSTSTTTERIPARERLLAAASTLFYEEGFNAVGIDRVIERAGVAKASLYDCFGSKEELVRSYLAERHVARQARVAQGLAQYATPRERLLGMFDILGKLMAENGFRGCAFVKANVEARPDASVQTVLAESRTWVRETFVGLARDAGARDAEVLAEQLMLLYDGAAVSAQMDRNPNAGAAARAMAAVMLDAATLGPRDDIEWSRGRVTPGGGVAATLGALRKARGKSKSPVKE